MSGDGTCLENRRAMSLEGSTPSPSAIYGLIDPRSGHLRYIGQTYKLLPLRLLQHISNAKANRKAHVYSWIRQLLLLKLEPEIEALEEFPTGIPFEELDEAEIFQIAYWKFLGAELTNHTEGGKVFRFTEEFKKQVSARSK